LSRKHRGGTAQTTRGDLSKWVDETDRKDRGLKKGNYKKKKRASIHQGQEGGGTKRTYATTKALRENNRPIAMRKKDLTEKKEGGTGQAASQTIRDMVLQPSFSTKPCRKKGTIKQRKDDA